MATPVSRDEQVLWSLRAAAVVVLAGLLLFLPLELHAALAEPLRLRLLPYVGFLAVTAGALAVSWTRIGQQHTDALSVGYIALMAMSALSYLWIVPGFSALVAMTLTNLAVGGAVIGAWSIERTALMGAALAMGFAVVGSSASHGPVGAPPLVFSLAGLLVGLGVAVACAAVLDRMRGSLTRRHRELTDLSARLMSVQEDERRRLSRELHDGVGQSLTAVLSYLWLVERQVPQEMTELRERVGETRRLASRTLAQIRDLSQLLRPSVLDDYGLVPSLDAHVRAFGERERITTSFTAEALPDRLPADIETAIYRITQEALANVARHAHAHSVQVRVGCAGGAVHLEVADDGVGLQANRNGNEVGMGLIGVRERVRALGGTMSLASDHGARLAVELPLPTDERLPAANERF